MQAVATLNALTKNNKRNTVRQIPVLNYREAIFFIFVTVNGKVSTK